MEGQQFDNPFEGIAVDTVVGASVMQLLGITPIDLSQPDKFNKLQDILKYVGNKQGGDYLLNRIVSGKTGDKLNIAWEYIGLRSKRDTLRTQIDTLTKELDLYK